MKTRYKIPNNKKYYHSKRKFDTKNTKDLKMKMYSIKNKKHNLEKKKDI
jgi:hypothetical protein